MNEIISVVIPVYQVEKYIEQAVMSVCNQTYKELEIILIDDGSTDESSKICDDFAEKDQRIKVIHQKNRGLSAARNTGIEHATGKYIAFVDSDDFIENNMYEIMLKKMYSEKADCVICNYDDYLSDCNRINKIEDTNKIEIFRTLEALNNIYIGKYNEGARTCVAWNKLWKIEMFNEIRFPVGKRNEDSFVIHHLFEKANRIVYINKTLYHYRIRENSIMRSNYTIGNLDDLEAKRDRMCFTKGKVSEALYYNICKDYFNTLMENVSLVRENIKDKNEHILKLSYQFKNDYRLERDILNWSFKQKIKLNLFRLFSWRYIAVSKYMKFWPYID